MRRASNAKLFRLADGRELTLRPLVMGDLPAVIRFARAMVKEKEVNRDLGLVAFDRRTTVAEEREFLKGVVQGRRRNAVVSVAAFDGERLVGNCDVTRRMRDDVMHAGTLGITVIEGYRGVGIGERLMREALDGARRAGIRLVQLTVFANNGPAISLYEKKGFRRAGVIPGKMVRDGRELDELIMYADLRGSDKSPMTGRPKS